MRWASWRANLLPVATFALGMLTAIAAAPVWKAVVIQLAQPKFSELTYKCDQAMRDHMIAKQTVSQSPSDATVQNLKAAEIALLDCQDYDLMRKRLIRWGLSDNELSEMALVAIEERASTLQDVVRIHEIRY